MDEVLTLREVTDDDADDLITLVGDAYAEYPGCVLDLDDLDADLHAPATAIDAAGGRWWVLEDAGRVVASVAAGPHRPDGTVELKRLYVAASHRRRGVAARLVVEVEGHAHEVGARGVTLWTDRRFLDAHRLYTRCGYVATGASRALHDLSNTTELEFVRHP